VNHGGQPHEAGGDEHAQEANGQCFHDKLLSGVTTGRVGRQRPVHLFLRMSRGYGCLVRTGANEGAQAPDRGRAIRELPSKTLPFAEAQGLVTDEDVFCALFVPGAESDRISAVFLPARSQHPLLPRSQGVPVARIPE